MISELFTNPLFNICFMVGLIFVLTGIFMFQFPPKKINSLYGYRTIQSMKTQENWDFAQKFSAKELMKLGLILMLFCSLVFFTNFNHSINMIIGLSLVILAVIVLFVRVETSIKAKFRN